VKLDSRNVPVWTLYRPSSPLLTNSREPMR
jgi:hypothetical protein